MKENLKNVARLILYAVYAFLISAVILKLWYENKNWLIISILCSVSNITANIIFNYKIYSDETQQGQAKIINFKTKLTEKNKTSMTMIIIDSIITIVGGLFYFCFFHRRIVWSGKLGRNGEISSNIFCCNIYWVSLYIF